MNRVEIQYGDEIIPVTHLTSRVLARTGQAVKVVEDTAREKPNGHQAISPDWDETVFIKQQLLENWDDLSGEEILEKLDDIWTTQNTGVPKVDLRQNLGLWLLKALAQEKCLYTDPKEIEDTYRHCRHLGRWKSVFVRNNLAALKAKRQECLDSLNLLAEAIELALQYKVPLKAPFYNAALIFQHLHTNRLIFEPKYRSILDKVSQSIQDAMGSPAGATPPKSDEDRVHMQPDGHLPLTESAEQANGAEGNDYEVEAAYKRIARYGYNIKEPASEEVFQRHVAYLVPSIDLFESFGDSADKVDTRTAHELFEQGNEFAAKEMFAAGIKSIEISVGLDPAREAEATERTDQITDQWRYHENQLMLVNLREGDFDKATNIILDLPDPRLRRSNDERVVAAIKRFKQSELLKEAEEATKLGDEGRAQLIYIDLLKDGDLDDTQRIYASSKLAEQLKNITSDGERHRKLNQMILHGLHPQVTKRVADEFEKRLTAEAVTLTQLEQFDRAIEKYLWALLLPERRQTRARLMQTALFVLERFLKDNPDIDACQPIADPIFADLKAELTERWGNNQKEALAAQFDRLDGEQWLRRKRIDALFPLLDDLIDYEPTTDRLLARMRLLREKAAQERFNSILTAVEKIFQEGSHSKRREAIFVELRDLRELAVDCAAGDHSAYAKQIEDFVLKTEAYLLQADNQRFKHEVTFASNKRQEEAFRHFKDSLKSEQNPNRILTDIGNLLHKTYGTQFFAQVTELSVHWLEQDGRAALRALAVEQPQQAGAMLREALAIIEHNRALLPEEFRGEFKSFLEELARQFEPPPPPPAPEPLPMQPPDGLVFRFRRWLLTKLRRSATR